MSVGSDELKLDTTENFQHLSRAPIVEAVIDIRARATVPWEERTISERLRAALPDYPEVASETGIRQEIRFGIARPPEAKQHELGWQGLSFKSGDGRHIAKFSRDGLFFSRLQPYENWERLRAEATRLWRIYSDLARPAEVQRLGLRFVNLILLPANELKFEEYVNPHAVPPHGLEALPFYGFFHQDFLGVPGSPYAISLIRTVHTQYQQVNAFGLILDIDVFTQQPFELHAEVLANRLAEMRWLKNKVFFGSITEKALSRFL